MVNRQADVGISGSGGLGNLKEDGAYLIVPILSLDKESFRKIFYFTGITDKGV